MTQTLKVPDGWKPITWTRDYDTFRAVIVLKPNGEAMYRVQSLTVPGLKHMSDVDSFDEAVSEVEKIVCRDVIVSSGSGRL